MVLFKKFLGGGTLNKRARAFQHAFKPSSTAVFEVFLAPYFYHVTLS